MVCRALRTRQGEASVFRDLWKRYWSSSEHRSWLDPTLLLQASPMVHPA